MQDSEKTKQELIDELEDLRQKLKGMDALVLERRRAEEALRESRERYRALVEEAPVSIMSFDRDGRVTSVNEWHLKVFGSSRLGADFFLGRKITELPGIVRAGISSRLEPLLRGEPVVLEDVFFPELSGGRSGYQTIRGVPLFKDGEFAGGVLIREDVSGRKQTEEALKEEKRFADQVINSLPGVFYLFDEFGTILRWNRNLETTSGCSAEEISGMSPLEFVAEEDRALALEAIQEVFAKGESSVECRFLMKDGGEEPYLFTGRLFTSKGRNYLLGVALDIGPRRKAELDTIRARDFYLTLFESFPALIWRSGLDGGCDYFNTTWLNFTGRSLEQELGDGWMGSVHPDDLEQCVKTYLEAFHAREPFQMEYRLKHRCGDYRWIVDTGRPFHDLDGRFTGFIGVCHDITERRKAEEKLTASLREKEILLKEIHHRVKNNLQVISSLLDLQSEYFGDPQQRECFKQSLLRVKSMALIHERLYQGHDLAGVDFAKYVEDLVTYLLQSYLIERDVITVRLAIPDVLLTVDNAVPCGIIITELVTNSLKHAFPDGRKGSIDIELRVEEDDQVTLRVKDDGVGLPPGMDFDHSTSLGFNIVATLVKQLNGALDLKFGGGTEWTISFFEQRSQRRG